jgi:RNAse (barnase) inhibitor barstar
MGKLIQRLQDFARSGVYRTSRVEPLLEAVRGSRLSFARIGLQKATDKRALLRTIAAELGFADWFGANWDALEDCLTDLSWREAEGHLLTFEGFQSLPADELATLIEVLISAAEFWSGRNKPFFAVFIDPGRTLMLAALFNEK